MTTVTKTITLSAALVFLCATGCKSKDSKHSKHKNKATTTSAKVTTNAEKKGPRIAVEVSSKGYVPKKISAKAGDNVLVFTRTADVGCGEFVKIAGLAGKTELPLNKPVEIGIHLPEKGEVRFACHMDMMTGVIAVR